VAAIVFYLSNMCWNLNILMKNLQIYKISATQKMKRKF